MTTTHPTKDSTQWTPRVWLSRGPTTDQPRRDTVVPGLTLPDDQRRRDTQTPSVVGEPATGDGQRNGDTQGATAVPGLLADPFLAMLAATVDDAEDVREKAEAHLRELVDPDLYNRSQRDPAVTTYTKVVADAQAYEDSVIKILKKAMHQHPLAAWMNRTPGVGDKQFARLLGEIGDPYWHSREDRPRLVSELWSYCGFHVIRTEAETLVGWLSGVAPKRQRGVQGNWNETARMRCRLIAESCLKAKTSPYQTVYYETRDKYAEAVHVHPCPQCGTRGTGGTKSKPAQPGTPLKLGHQHARALRAVAKAFLKDLWHECERLHNLQAAANHAPTPKERAPLPAPTSGNGQAATDTQVGSTVPGLNPGDEIIYSDRNGSHTARILHITNSGLLALQRDNEVIYRQPQHVRTP